MSLHNAVVNGILPALLVASCFASEPEFLAQGGSNGSPSAADLVYAQWLGKVAPNVAYPNACNSSVTFNDPGAWAHGNASMTVALVKIYCTGVSRQLHWHPEADEWGYVVRGEVYTYIVSPDGLPWPVSTNRLQEHGVWYFPKGWFHGFVCAGVGKDGREGCEVVLTFNTPVMVPIDNHNADSTLAQATNQAAANAMNLPVDVYAEQARPRFEDSEEPSAETSPLLLPAIPGACLVHCPPIAETTAKPAAVSFLVEGRPTLLSGGVEARDLRTAQFPFAKTMSQQLLFLTPGQLRGENWVTNANALVVATQGEIEVHLQGGVTDETAHKAFISTLGPGDAFYVPIGRNYWLREATGQSGATAVVTFDTGSWRSAEFRESLGALPSWIVQSSLRGAPPPEVLPTGLSSRPGEAALLEDQDTRSSFGRLEPFSPAVVTALLMPPLLLLALVLYRAQAVRELRGSDMREPLVVA